MANYTIMRFKKLKTKNEIRGALQHAYREIATPNADPNIRNITFSGMPTSSKEAMEKHEQMLPKKYRKDAVTLVEFMVTASNIRELSLEQQKAYFIKASQYLANRMGGKNNIVHAEIHLDEKEPHLTMFVTPKNAFGKLNGAEMLGKTPQAIRDFQTEFHQKVAKEFGFERGVMNDKPRKHEELRNYMKNVEHLEKKVSELTAENQHLKAKLAKYEPPKEQISRTLKMGM